MSIFKNRSRLFLIILLFGIVASCNSAYYIHDLESTPYGVDYSKGKWLLNDIDGPYTIKDKLEEIAKKEFSKNLGDSLICAKDSKTFALPYVPINPDTLALKRAKKISKFDFLINIKGSNIKNELGFKQDGYIDMYKKNVSETILQIYDLNTLEIIYSRKVIGKVTHFDEDDNSVRFVKRPNGMILKSLKRIFKKLNK